MPINIKRTFKRHCGSAAVFVGSMMQNRGEHNTVSVQFEMVPEGRKFSLDGVIYEPCGDAQIEAAVVKIADIAKNIRVHISAEA